MLCFRPLQLIVNNVFLCESPSSEQFLYLSMREWLLANKQDVAEPQREIGHSQQRWIKIRRLHAGIALQQRKYRSEFTRKRDPLKVFTVLLVMGTCLDRYTGASARNARRKRSGERVRRQVLHGPGLEPVRIRDYMAHGCSGCILDTLG
jgi:hypothetical protein